MKLNNHNFKQPKRQERVIVGCRGRGGGRWTEVVVLIREAASQASASKHGLTLR